jgi:hypothetical protein
MIHVAKDHRSTNYWLFNQSFADEPHDEVYDRAAATLALIYETLVSPIYGGHWSRVPTGVMQELEVRNPVESGKKKRVTMPAAEQAARLPAAIALAKELRAADEAAALLPSAAAAPLPTTAEMLSPAYALRKRTTDAAYWATQDLVEATCWDQVR